MMFVMPNRNRHLEWRAQFLSGLAILGDWNDSSLSPGQALGAEVVATAVVTKNKSMSATADLPAIVARATQ